MDTFPDTEIGHKSVDNMVGDDENVHYPQYSFEQTTGMLHII